MSAGDARTPEPTGPRAPAAATSRPVPAASPRPGGRLSTRLLAATLLVVGIALAIVAIGVLRVGGEAFEALMVAAGARADHAPAMVDPGITRGFLLGLCGGGEGGGG